MMCYYIACASHEIIYVCTYICTSKYCNSRLLCSVLYIVHVHVRTLSICMYNAHVRLHVHRW